MDRCIERHADRNTALVAAEPQPSHQSVITRSITRFRYGEAMSARTRHLAHGTTFAGIRVNVDHNRSPILFYVWPEKVEMARP